MLMHLLMILDLYFEALTIFLRGIGKSSFLDVRRINPAAIAL
jgi:hypothetical protein